MMRKGVVMMRRGAVMMWRSEVVMLWLRVWRRGKPAS